jgi:hypothetical protein
MAPQVRPQSGRRHVAPQSGCDEVVGLAMNLSVRRSVSLLRRSWVSGSTSVLESHNGER